MKWFIILLISLSSCVTCEVVVQIKHKHPIHKNQEEIEEEYQDNLEKKELVEFEEDELFKEQYEIVHSLDTLEFDVHSLKIPH